MNGRCETDPFDRAVDVCRICYGEFCWTCLVESKGRDQPMCRECALIVGGLRPKAKPRVRGSKKTVKARREALREAREAPRHHGANFTFFDVGDDHSFVGFQDAGSPARSQEPRNTPEAPPPPEVKDSPAVRRLDSIRRADRQGSPEADQFANTALPVPDAAPPTHQPASQDPASALADIESFGLETYTSGPQDQAASAAHQPAPGLSGTAPISHEPPLPPTALPDDSEDEMPVGYAPPPWEALAAPSDLAQMKPESADDVYNESDPSTSNADTNASSNGGDNLDFDFDEPAEFRKPRPFVTAAAPAAPAAPASAAPAVPAASAPNGTSHADQAGPAGPPSPNVPAAGPAVPAVQEVAPAPSSGQPSATPPPEFAIASVGRTEPEEPVHIHDDPWARTGPEVVSTAPLPKRRPDPKPSEDSSTSPPDWTKAKLPKFD